MKSYLIILLVILFYSSSFSQSESPNHQVLILGNIADVTEHDDFMATLEARINTFQSPFSLIMNGDLADGSFESGIDPLTLAKRVMDLIQSAGLGKLIIVPGDRDWNSSKKGGQKMIAKIEKEVKDYKKRNNYKRIKWIADKGCPGPYILKVDESLVFIAINTQWWNHPYDKPRPSDGICNIITHRDFMEELEDAVDENKDKNVLIFGHHPFKSLGNYGGYFSFGNRMTPFPIFGSFNVAFKREVGSAMDISNENLEPLVEGLKNLFFFNKNLIYVSSHEHNQQIIIDNENFIINSGALEKGNYVGKDPNAWFTSEEPGWIELKYHNNGAVESLFIAADKEKGTDKTMKVFDSACSSSSMSPNPNTPTNLSYTPCFDEEEVPKKMMRKYPSTIEVVAGEEYKASKWKQFWWGKHYRSTWTTPVVVPYLDLDTTFNGLTVYKKGGGRQTTSLKFRSEDRTVYVLRSVNKDPSKAFNYKLRPTLVATVTKDQTSTQHPYGAMAVDPLLDKINILHASPTLYLLPDDEKLGHYQYTYGNLFGMLEQNHGPKNEAGIRFGQADKIVRSNKFFRELYDDHKNKIDIDEFIRSRVFDILVGDWSKHEDNWKWAKYKSDSITIFRPIPRDRDHVFSKQDGFWPWLADRPWALQNIENFDYKIKGLKSLMWQARHMDRFVSTEATRELWIAEAKFIQSSISEEDIYLAVKNMPMEIYDKSGAVVAEKLKQRLKDLPKYAEKYYELLAEEVDIIGSAEREYFEIERADDGTISVSMYDRTPDHKKGKTRYYYRKFYPKETAEIRVFGLGGGDVFNITGNSSKKIKLRILGGSGDDTFFESGTKKAGKTLIYDKGKSTALDIGKGAKMENSWNKDVYEYDRTKFKYDRIFPLAYLNYSQFNGLTLAGGITMTNYKYDKEDYAVKFSAVAGFSTKGNLKLVIDSRFHHAIKKWDILYRISVADPEFHNNFFGLGNATVKTDADESANFYEIEYSKNQILVGFAREFWKNSEFDITFGVESNESKKLDQITILDENPMPPGAYEELFVIPFNVGLNLDFRDEKGLPYSGTNVVLNYTNGTFLNSSDNFENPFDYGYFDGSFEYYISSPHKKRVTFGLRFGGALGYGDIPFYKMPNLGGTNGLRGYSGQRFTGDSKIFLNTELRWQLLQKYTPLFPIKFGVKAFFDTGRVYYSAAENEPRKWHKGYGAGIYIVPFEEAFIVSISVGFSEEESFYPIIGIGTPLR